MKMDKLIEELERLVNEGFEIPLSGKVAMNAERLKELIEEMRSNMPQEVRQAKTVVAERNAIIRDANEEAERIVQQAEERVKSMVMQSEIVKQAQIKASEIISTANKRASEINRASTAYVEGLMKKADEELSRNLADLKKTRQGFKNYQQSTSTGTSSRKNGHADS